MKMLQTRLILAALAALLTAPALADRNAELEAEVAREFARMKATLPLTTDEGIIEYVSCVANALVMVLEPPESEYDWEMAIFDTEMLNASAGPGGKIMVYEGILRAARNQHQLAAVIGHEIAHVTAEHTRKRLNRSGKAMEVGIQVAAVLLGGGHYGAQYTAETMLNEGALYGLVLPYKRDQESEADVIGLEYMAKAGFDPRQAVPLWQNMADQAGGERPAEFVSTHPSEENRIDELIDQWIKVLPLYNQAHEEGRIPDCRIPDSLQARYDRMDQQE